ncbi:MAG: CoA-binding protein [Chitinivibrionales bacterium]|nr:CoA-binding protein [Chitinivibrionales bacterium]
MKKITRDFFINKEVLFIGYSSRNARFSKEIYEAFVRHGLTVYALNKNSTATFDVIVYRSFAQLPKVPKTAYILTNKKNIPGLIPALYGNGVTRILFHSPKLIDDEIISQCKGLGIETATACPLMLFGGRIHKIHAFIVGVRS